MIAAPRPTLWLPWQQPAPRWPSLRDRRSWLRRIIDPIAAYALGDPCVDSSGNVMLDSGLNPMVDDGSGYGCRCRFQCRKCSDNSLAGVYVKKSQFPSWPSAFVFWDGSQCLSVSPADCAPCTATPLATIVTTYSDCTTCTNAHTSSTPCPACSAPTLPSSVTVSGLDGLMSDCGGSFPYTVADCSQGCGGPTNYTTWNGVMTKGCDTGVIPNLPKYVPNLSSTWVLHFSNGACAQVQGVSLECHADDGNGVPGWNFQIDLFPTCGGGEASNNNHLQYVLNGGASPTGTYTYVTQLGSCAGGTLIGAPATITVS